MIFNFFRKDPIEEKAIALYERIVEAARRPEFYTIGQAPDTVEGRFEILSLHVYLTLRRLKNDGEAGKALSQKVFDVFFKNMDDSLRELGVGDLTVGKKIRAMAEAFYGRTGAYEVALDGRSSVPDPERELDATNSKRTADKNKLASALTRNILGLDPEDGVPAGANAIADFILRADIDLGEQSFENLQNGSISFVNFVEKGPQT
ncbi:MAG: ubiquinol-cytochrome C chaperone family protein [Pseudomonadota bacterium]